MSNITEPILLTRSSSPDSSWSDLDERNSVASSSFSEAEECYNESTDDVHHESDSISSQPRDNSSQEPEIANLRAENSALRTANATLRFQISSLKTKIARLLARIDILKSPPDVALHITARPQAKVLHCPMYPIANYSPRERDELSLQVGDIVDVEYEYWDGWGWVGEFKA
ncbi:hypothetical protein M427DRAFT_30193 [Gonapodya prolifera JEL478]|uniref:Uncharacterized protein n=1 Tax=Gonapodya prolifera (strain JEL478) TaxID=1344416 RepID=A0A139ALP6_GONPJ|nr:hypothetical protein M427DRAFT_30193 [Gonapodya prolifera JEL478]|eukprot:KXS17717.1 hypothetical protein M427DRAFT_30193 [Gonapodya prolifera JEL478]